MWHFVTRPRGPAPLVLVLRGDEALVLGAARPSSPAPAALSGLSDLCIGPPPRLEKVQTSHWMRCGPFSGEGSCRLLQMVRPLAVDALVACLPPPAPCCTPNAVWMLTGP